MFLNKAECHFCFIIILFFIFFITFIKFAPSLPQEEEHYKIEVNCRSLVKEFSKYPDVLKEIHYSKENMTCSLEIANEKKDFFPKPTDDFFKTIEQLYDINSDIDLTDKNSQKDDISWAFATAELVRSTRSRIIGAKLISVKKIAALLLYLYQNPKMMHKRNPQEICPLFRIHCPLLQEYQVGECKHYTPVCLFYRLTGNPYWKKTKTVTEQVKDALDKGRVLYGVFESKNKEWGDYPDYAAVISSHFEGYKGNTEVYFRNFREIKSKAVSAYMDVRNFKKIYDGYHLEKGLSSKEKDYKLKFEYF